MNANVDEGTGIKWPRIPSDRNMGVHLTKKVRNHSSEAITPFMIPLNCSTNCK